MAGVLTSFVRENNVILKTLSSLLVHDKVSSDEVKTLIESGVNLNELCEDGLTCLHKIVGLDNKEEDILPVVHSMLTNKADPNIKSSHSLTAVHICAVWGKADILRLLLKFGGDPNLFDGNCMNAYDLAEKYKELDVLEILLDHQGKNGSRAAIKCSPSVEDIFASNGILSPRFNRMKIDRFDQSSEFRYHETEIAEEELGGRDVKITLLMPTTSCRGDSIPAFDSASDGDSFLNDRVTGAELATSGFSRNSDNLSPEPRSPSSSSVHNNPSPAPSSSSDYVHKDPITGAELVERATSNFSCCNGDDHLTVGACEDSPTGTASTHLSVISFNSSDLNVSSSTEIYDWRRYHSCSYDSASETSPLGEITEKSISIDSCRSIIAEYSVELQNVLRGDIYLSNLSTLESDMRSEFERADPSKNWREGIVKSSFNYMLLDARVTNNLPARAPNLTEQECLRCFLASVFYVGKGKHARPYHHLYEALNCLKNGNRNMSQKIRHIMDIWDSGNGIVSLHCFQNVIPVEAYTREASMIDAIGIDNLTNIRKGDYYGPASRWNDRKKNTLGAYLIIKALKIFLIEGERQLFPVNLKI